ncbi:MAG TPA: glycosyltransferase [Bryobacteraceae bacterium]|nr:glycosyltransferase [Bryobacteraceae bacterium]
MPRLDVALIYIDSGGGHRAAANALCQSIRERGLAWDVRLVSIQEVLDPVDFIRKFTGIPFQDTYNLMLRHGWTRFSKQLIPVMHGLIRASHRAQVNAIQSYWRTERPDLVVSLIPHYNRAIKEALDNAWPGVPYVTLLTDIADYPPHFWIEPLDQWVICGSDRAAAQAREIGLGPGRILQTSGMILHPKFYAPASADRQVERIRRGLHPDKPTGLVLFGAEGSREMPRIARAIEAARQDVQLIFICGRNDALAADLRAMRCRVPIFVEGFTREMPLYMEMSDFFIGKPGPGCISEALAKRLPVIVPRNALTLAHEVYNAQWIREIGAGIVIPDFGQTGEAVRELLANYAAYRERAAAIRNHAVYEVPEMLLRILRQSARMPQQEPEPELIPTP